MNHLRLLQDNAEKRVRSISAPSDDWNAIHSPCFSTAPSDPSLHLDISIASYYQNVIVPAHAYSQSYPASPRLTPQNPHRFQGASVSYPVFPNNAQTYYPPQRSHTNSKPIREAVLFTKNRDGAIRKDEGKPILPGPPPKMHLFASRKVQKKEPKEEDFPVPPVEWLIGGSKSNESSLVSSEIQSRDSSEDESEESAGTSGSSSYCEPSTPVLGGSADSVRCQILSMGLKALLKVSA